MKILVIEDDDQCLDLILKTLKKQKFTVDFTQDGLEGFERARASKYDVIVMDVMLPNKTGFEIVSGLRALNVKTPILILSGRSMTEDKVLGLSLGADDYLTKSFAPEELLARVKNLIRRNMPGHKTVLKHKDLMINLASMQVYRNHEPINLSRKELGILMELMKRKNHVVSRSELVAAAWGDRDMEVGSNTIDVHIKSLRAKVDKPYETKLIKTVRGFGYIMSD